MMTKKQIKKNKKRKGYERSRNIIRNMRQKIEKITVDLVRLSNDKQKQVIRLNPDSKYQPSIDTAMMFDKYEKFNEKVVTIKSRRQRQFSQGNKKGK